MGRIGVAIVLTQVGIREISRSDVVQVAALVKFLT